MKYFFVFGLLICIFTSYSQVVYNFNDFAEIGETYNYSGDSVFTENVKFDDFAIDEGVWDFSSLTLNNSKIIEFLTPENTSYFGYFPNSNVVSQTENELVYLNLSENKIETLGYYGKLPTNNTEIEGLFKFTNPLTYITFPFTYLSGYNDVGIIEAKFHKNEIPNSQIPAYIDSVKIISTISEVCTVDTFGIIITPIDNYEVVRIRKYDEIENDIYGKSYGYWILINDMVPIEYRFDTLLTYQFYSPVLGAAVMAFENDYQTENIITINYSTDNLSSENYIFETNPFLFPSVAKDMIFLNSEYSENYFLEIYGINGNKLYSNKLNGISELNISFLENGLYFCMLFDSKNKIVSRQKIIVLK